MSLSTTGLIFDERFLAHDTGEASLVRTRSGSFQLSPDPHFSSKTITRRTKEFLDVVGLTSQMRPLPARAATEDELAVFHTRAYIAGMRRYAAGGPSSGPWGSADEGTLVSPGSFEAALYAAGGAIQAVQAVMEGTVRNAYALLRPPGHHAQREQALGYCIFNNAVLAAHYARKQYQLERIMLIDWDAHPGNGSQDAFYQDPGLLFLSLHQQDWFPRGCGALEQTGTGPGSGFTVNIPLPPGTGDMGYRAAFEQIVLPIARQYRPQLILVSSGQDASWLDPLARMLMTMQGFRTLSELLVSLAAEVCAGRLVMLQEGGYSTSYVPFCTAATIEPLLGIDLGIEDLSIGEPELETCQTYFSSETRNSLHAAQKWHKHWWHL